MDRREEEDKVKKRWYLILSLVVTATGCSVRPAVQPHEPFVSDGVERSSPPREQQSAATDSIPLRYHPRQVGELENPALQEASGLAASRRRADRLWVLNDGGDAARIYAIGPDGSDQGAVRIEGARNEDWEDMASFRWEGKPYLLIADIGDNQARRNSYRLYFVREPQDPLPARVTASRVMEFVYEDGPRDAEAIAVDPKGGRILILSKRDRPPRLYELPLSPDRRGIQVARYITSIPPLPQPSFGDILANPVLGGLGDVPTAMDLSPDGSRAVVMTYRAILLYRRLPGMAWREVFSRPPEKLAAHDLLQGEALAFDARGVRIYYTSEHRPAPLWALLPYRPGSGEKAVKQPAGGSRGGDEQGQGERGTAPILPD